MSSYVDFEPGIIQLWNMLHPDHDHSPDALDLLHHLITDVNSKLVEAAIKSFQENVDKTDILHPYCFQMAVEKLFTGRLRTSAINEGVSSVFRFCMGLSNFSARTESTSSACPDDTTQISDGRPTANLYNDLGQLISVGFDADAKLYISKILRDIYNDLTEKISEKLRCDPNREELNVELLNEVIRENFGPSMAECAIISGSNGVDCYQYGMILSNDQSGNLCQLNIPETRDHAEDMQLREAIASSIRKYCSSSSFQGLQLDDQAYTYLNSFLTAWVYGVAKTAVISAIKEDPKTVETDEIDTAVKQLLSEVVDTIEKEVDTTTTTNKDDVEMSVKQFLQSVIETLEKDPGITDSEEIDAAFYDMISNVIETLEKDLDITEPDDTEVVERLLSEVLHTVESDLYDDQHEDARDNGSDFLENYAVDALCGVSGGLFANTEEHFKVTDAYDTADESCSGSAESCGGVFTDYLHASNQQIDQIDAIQMSSS